MEKKYPNLLSIYKRLEVEDNFNLFFKLKLVKKKNFEKGYRTEMIIVNHPIT